MSGHRPGVWWAGPRAEELQFPCLILYLSCVYAFGMAEQFKVWVTGCVAVESFVPTSPSIEIKIGSPREFGEMAQSV